MASVEKELEDRLREVGSRLASPPSAVSEILPLLDQAESLLSRVDQSPTQSMSNALRPSMKALVAKELLGHSEMDVKVAVASCVSEITRITAPEAPYDDDLMKEIFQRIVEAFEHLDDMTNRSFPKRVSVLETVAKVRSCVVMLDLECDSLILEMFRHFMKTLRANHSEKIFSSMETIMTLVLEESEDISSELILCLLDSVKSDKDILPVVRRLGEKVISNCAGKLKPYIVELFQSTGMPLNAYGEAVASICQESSACMERNDVDDSKQSERTVSDELVQGSEKMEQEVGCPEEVTSTEKSPKSAMGNGTFQMDNGESTVEPSSPKQKPEPSHSGDQSKRISEENRDVPVNSESVAIKQDAISDFKAKKTRGKQTNSSVNMKNIADHSLVDDSLGKEQSGEHDLVRPSVADSKAVKDSLPAQAEVPDSTRPKRGRPSSKLAAARVGGSAAAEQPASPLQKKGSEMGDKPLSSKDSGFQKESDGISESDDIKEPETVTRDSEEKSQRQTSRKGSTSKIDHGDSSQKLRTSKTKQQNNLKAKKDIAGGPISKHLMSFSKSATKAPKDQGNLEESAKTKSGRKREHTVQEISETLTHDKDLDGSLVGSRIKVWWPLDKRFYYGVVESYNHAEQTHKIAYNDGDTEILLLQNERWEFVEDNETDEEQGRETSNPDASSEEPKSKRAKTSLSSIRKETNIETPSKSGTASNSHRKGRPRKAAVSNVDDGPSSSSKLNEKAASRSKDDSSKSTIKLKDDVKSKGDNSRVDKSISKTGNEMKDNALKSSRKSMDGTPKSASKTKDNADNASSNVRKDASKAKSSEESPKTGQKLRGKTTSKTGSESKANVVSEKGKSKVRESEAPAKLSSNLTPKAPESEASAGKKRKRKGQT